MRSLVVVACVLLVLSACKKQDAAVADNSESGIPEDATVTAFKDNPSLATVEEKNSSGTLLLEGHLFNNKRSGNWIEYFPDGKVHLVVSYINGEKEGPYMEFDESGQIVTKCDYHNDQRNGIYRAYSYGRVTEESTYVNGHLEGPMKKYYSDTGTIMEESNYKNGTMDGTAKWYDQAGKVTIQYEYEDGKLVKK